MRGQPYTKPLLSKAKQTEHVTFKFEDEVIEDDDVTGGDQTQLKARTSGWLLAFSSARRD